MGVTTGPNPIQPEEQQMQPSDDQLQAPQAPSAPDQMQLQPQGPSAPPAANQPPPPAGHNYKLLSDSFMGSVLGALAGKPNPGYTVNKDTGKMERNADVPQTTGDKLREIARSALTGLAAGGQVGPQKSAAASWGAGIGAGAQAVTEQNQQQDLLKRKQAQNDFENDQQMTLRKAENARMNMETYSNYLKNVGMENELDPDRQEHIDVYNAFKNAGAEVSKMSPEEYQQKLQSDPQFIVSHIGLPGGYSVDPNVKNADGTPMKKGVVLVIGGLHDGNVDASAKFKADVAKYLPIAGASGGVDNLPDEVPAARYANLLGFINKGKQMEREGWQHATDVLVGDVHKQMNPVTHEVADYPANSQPNVKNNAAVGAADVAEKGATTAEKNQLTAESKAKQAKTEAETKLLTSMGVPPPPPTFKLDDNAFSMKSDQLRADLQAKGATVPPNFDTMYAIGHYKSDLKGLPPKLTKGITGTTRDAATTYIHQYINPNYDEGTYAAVQKMRADFAKTTQGTSGGNLIAFNTATGHLGRYYDAALALKNNNLQDLNNLAVLYHTKTGDSAPVVFNAVKTALVGELAKTFKGAAADVPEAQAIGDTLLTYNSPQQAIDGAKEYANLMLSKANAQVSHYRAYTGEVPPEALDPEAKDVYKKMKINTSALEGNIPVGTYNTTPAAAPQSAPVNAPAGAMQRPPDLPTASGFAPANNGKVYWHTADGKVLREATPEEIGK